MRSRLCALLASCPGIAALRVCVGLRARHGLCRLQFDKPTGQSEHAHRPKFGMRPAGHSRSPVILAHDPHAMAAAGETVVDQPGEHPLTRRRVAISKILADATLPVSKWFHALFNESAIGSLVTGRAGSTLILDMGRSRKAKTRRHIQRPLRFCCPKKLHRLLDRAPAFLGCVRFLAARRVYLAAKERL